MDNKTENAEEKQTIQVPINVLINDMQTKIFNIFNENPLPLAIKGLVISNIALTISASNNQIAQQEIQQYSNQQPQSDKK